MTFNPDIHHRRSIRLPEYDYTQPGWYYVTICVDYMERLFGDVINMKMMLNEMGRIIKYHWEKLPKHFKNILMDECIIMPNHLHGIVRIVGAKHSKSNNNVLTKNVSVNASPLRPNGTNPGSLPAIIQNFKSITTRKINQIRKSPGARVWQHNYYEHVIRNENDLNRIRQYIINNPLKWPDDDYNK